MLRSLLEFSFTPHPIYNVSKYRLGMLSLFVRNRAAMLLERMREVELIRWEDYCTRRDTESGGIQEPEQLR